MIQSTAAQMGITTDLDWLKRTLAGDDHPKCEINSLVTNFNECSGYAQGILSSTRVACEQIIDAENGQVTLKFYAGVDQETGAPRLDTLQFKHAGPNQWRLVSVDGIEQPLSAEEHSQNIVPLALDI